MSLLTALRERTATHHRRLESHSGILSALESIETYKALVAKLHGFYLPLEPILHGFSEWSEIGFDVDRRSKLPLLFADLIDLGMTPSHIAGLACHRPSVPLPDFAFALGCAYVIEGSTLGGQIISRHLASLGLAPQYAGRYFASYGISVGRMWAEFRSMLESQAEIVDEESVISGAINTFTAFEHWLGGGQAASRQNQVSVPGDFG